MISVVITTHGEAKDLPVMLGSLKNQRVYGEGKNSRTGAPYEYEAKGIFKEQIEAIVVCDGPYKGDVDTTEVSKLIECPKKGGVGHHTRARGIQAATQDWIVLTNSDNYFCQGWAHQVFKNISPNVGLIYWDIVNNLWKWTHFGGARIARGHIDLSCVAVRSDIAKKVGYPYEDYDSDFDYIAACGGLASSNGLEVVRISEILGVHN